MLDDLIRLIGRAGPWGYLVIFAGAALESAAFLGLLVPGESLVLSAGFLASRGVFDLPALIAVVALGAVVGDTIGYEMGRVVGRRRLVGVGRRVGLTDARLDAVDAFFGRHGGKSVLLGRFIGFFRALVPFAAGTSRMPYLRFLFWNGLGGVAWAIYTTLLGYFFGASFGVIEKWIGRASWIVLAAVVAAWLVLKSLRRRRRARERQGGATGS